MIGKIYTSLVPFYNIIERKHMVKARPVLIISDIRNNDYTILPVSTVSKRANLDKEFDIELNPLKYPALKIDHTSYVRTHKQMTIHKGELGKEISDLKTNYPKLFLQIMSKRAEWNKKIDDEALN